MSLLANLLSKVPREFVPRDVLVQVGVDLLENVDGGGSVFRVEELDVKVQRGAPGDGVSGPLLAVGQVRRHDQATLFPDAHVDDALVPAPKTQNETVPFPDSYETKMSTAGTYLMTCPTPSWNLKGSLRSTEESNFVLKEKHDEGAQCLCSHMFVNYPSARVPV